MIPLILIALGLGAALTVYEFSPKTRSRVDAYVHAIRSADVAHQAANTHLENSNAIAATAARHAQQAAEAAQQAAAWVQAEAARQTTAWQQQQQQPTQPAPQNPIPAPVSPAVVEAQANAAQVAANAAVDQAAAALQANQAAAKATAEAAANAQNEAQRQAASESAAKVLESEKKIAAAFAGLGVGQCEARVYKRVTESVKDTLLARLRKAGMGVAGDNPWIIDTHKYGIKLRAVWDPRASVVKLIVTAGKGATVIPLFKSVTCQDIWDEIEPIMKEVIG